MSTPQMPIGIDATDLATSNISCRILVVSPSSSQALALISRLQKLGQAAASTAGEARKVGEGSKNVLFPDLVKIPWTIENKYYSADVHFAVHPMRGLAPYLLQNVPAVIFVWGSNEAYKHHIKRLSHDLNGQEPEVSLAVRVKSLPDEAPAEPVDAEERGEDNAAIDGFVSGFGFEYIDATRDVVDQREERQYEEEDESDSVPNLPRVLDALSTVMWPSMKAREKGTKYGNARAQRDPSLFEWGTGGSQNHGLSLVDDLVTSSSSQLSARAKRMQGEMEELARWLETDVHDSDGEDPWRMAVRSDVMITSPTEVDEGFFGKFSSTSSQEKHDGRTGSSMSPPTNSAKFDDDFTVFVSAPAIETQGVEQGSGRSTPAGNGAEDQDGLKPSDGLRSYNSLGSVSDFGESEGSKETMNVIPDEDDEDLPTQEEILETSSRIFGKKGNLRATDSSRITQSAEPRSSDCKAEFEGDDEYDLAPFDLSRVLGALQQMKEEISGMENEDERRKAAARIALGLVYGLEAEGDLN